MSPSQFDKVPHVLVMQKELQSPLLSLQGIGKINAIFGQPEKYPGGSRVSIMPNHQTQHEAFSICDEGLA